MSHRFIRMPWDEPTQYRWTSDEVDALHRLRRQGLSSDQIADRLAEEGFPPRDETAICAKLRTSRVSA